MLLFPGMCAAESLETLTIGTHQFHVEIADTPEKQDRGLMWRTELAPDRGMLFPLETERVASMWMKNTLIPLDMLFIDRAGVIRYIAASTTPRSETIISSPIAVKAILELPGGTCRKYRINDMDLVQHPLFKSPLAVP